MNGGCYCSLGHTPCNCGLVEHRAIEPIKSPEEESPWLWLLYAVFIVGGALLPAVLWRPQ